MAKLKLINLSCDVPGCVIPAIYEVSIETGWLTATAGKFCEPHAGQELAVVEAMEQEMAQ